MKKILPVIRFVDEIPEDVLCEIARQDSQAWPRTDGVVTQGCFVPTNNVVNKGVGPIIYVLTKTKRVRNKVLIHEIVHWLIWLAYRNRVRAKLDKWLDSRTWI